jgi:hypothetical protein
MIKVFRKIRQNMIKENRASKYLLYAIGEIILVMIGILLALQVNNWNEKRNSTLQEITILKNIQEDILLDTLDISFNIDKHKEYLDAEKRLLYFLQSDLAQPIDSLDYSSALGVPLTIALHKSTFNNLQNNQIGIITNNKLKKDISRFYDFFVQAVSMIENERPVYESYSSKKPFFQKYFKLSRVAYELNNIQSNNEDYYNPNLTKANLEFKDITGAKIDDAFKIELNESVFIRQVKIDFYVDMVNRIKELDEAINKELKALRN